jgi:tetratricopeptide (TPR) repeat protein
MPMKKFLIILIISLPFTLSGNDNMLLMEEAAKSYNAENFSQAAELYLKVIDNGYESSGLYYNLGNTYFKMGDMPSALLYFEKARKLNPADEDIIFNIQIANSRIVDKIDPVPDLFWVRWWNGLLYSFTADQWGWITLVTFTLIFVLLLFFLLSTAIWLKKVTFWSGIVMIALFIASFFLANEKYKTFRNDHEAIIFTPTLTVKSSPSDSGIDLFVIHEGTKVKLTDQVGEWFRIEIANGSVGWVQKESFKKI